MKLSNWVFSRAWTSVSDLTEINDQIKWVPYILMLWYQNNTQSYTNEFTSVYHYTNPDLRSELENTYT